MSNNPRKLFKHNPSDAIWWIDTTDKDGGFDFTFDKEIFYNMFLDYPHNLTSEQKEIFDRENPFWKEFFEERTIHYDS